MANEIKESKKAARAVEEDIADCLKVFRERYPWLHISDIIIEDEYMLGESRPSQKVKLEISFNK